MKRNVVLLAVSILVPGFISCARNQAPGRPAVPSGVSAGLKDSTYSFSTSVSDPDGDRVAVLFAWGDEDTSDWSGLFASGETVTVQYAWSTPGIQMVQARARDESGAESEWSGAHSVVVTPTPGNWPPGIPGVLPGFGTGYVGARLEVMVVASDPDDDTVSVRLAWGDGDTSDWTEFEESGDTFVLEHVYDSPGRYPLTAQARDSAIESEWSAPLTFEAVVPPFPYRIPGRVELGRWPQELALSPDGAWLYVAARDSLYVIRTSDMVVDRAVAVGVDLFGVTVAPDGHWVYVSDWSRNYSVWAVRTADDSVAQIPLPRYAHDVVASPDGDWVYASYGNHSVAVISTAELRQTDSIETGPDPAGLVLSPDGEYLYVANDWVSVVRTSDLVVVDTITLWGPPWYLAVSPDGDRLYVTDGDDGAVFAVDTRSREVVATIQAKPPNGVLQAASSSDGDFLFVTSPGRDAVTVVRTSDNTVVGEFPVGRDPSGICVSPDGQRVYVALENERSVVVLGY